MTDSLATDEEASALAQSLAQSALDDDVATAIYPGEMTEQEEETTTPRPVLPSTSATPSANTTTTTSTTTVAAAGPLVVPHPSSLPLTLTRRWNVLNLWETDVVLQFFTDRTVVLLSQLKGGRVGQWFLCEAHPDPTRLRSWEFAVSTLLGAPRQGDALEAEGSVYAKRLCRELALLQEEAVGGTVGAPTLLLGLGLHPNAQGRPDVFRAILDAVVPLLRQVLLQGHPEGTTT